MTEPDASAVPQEQRLDGQVALVIGGGWNIGRAISERLAAAGASVCVASRNAAHLAATAHAIRGGGGRCVQIPTDACNAAQVDRLVQQTIGELGGVDILVVTVGNSGSGRPLDETPATEIEAVLRDNMLPLLLASRAVLSHFRAQDRGSILALAGGGAFFPEPAARFCAYAAAKAGVCRFVDQLQAELLDTAIRVHGLEPGLVWSDERQAEVAAEEARTGEVHPEREHYRPPAMAAELANWLVSAASEPLRGRVVSVNDGFDRDRASAREVEQTLHRFRLRRHD